MSFIIYIDQIEGSGPLQVSLGEARGKEHRSIIVIFITIDIIIAIIIFTIIAIFITIFITILKIKITRYQISKGEDGEVNVEVVLGTQADQAADE